MSLNIKRRYKLNLYHCDLIGRRSASATLVYNRSIYFVKTGIFNSALTRIAHFQSIPFFVSIIRSKTTNSLDNFPKLAIYLDCSEPLGGFCFTVKVPESVSRIGDGVLGENASNLLLASGKSSDTLKLVGYSLMEDNLPQGYFLLLELPFEADNDIRADDFEILSADFSSASGLKINAAIKLIVGKQEGRKINDEQQSDIASGRINAYPNPFNSAITIRFATVRPQPITVEIYDLLGRKVNTLSDGFFAEGEHAVTWNGTNQRGDSVAAGVYLCRIKSQMEDTTLKLNYMK